MEPSDIKGIEDLDKLPFTTKEDLRDNYPFGLFAVPQSEIVLFTDLQVLQVRQPWLAIQKRHRDLAGVCNQSTCNGRGRYQ